jgi:hypothetical protein
MTRVDDDFKVVVQLLRHIPAKLGGHWAVDEGIMTRDPEVNFISRIQHPDFRALGRSPPFVGLSLAEIGDRGCLQPDEIVERSVHPGRALDSHGLGNALRERCVSLCSGLCLLPKH